MQGSYYGVQDMLRTTTKPGALRVKVVWLGVLLCATLFAGCQSHAE